jgi:hypothetical protein
MDIYFNTGMNSTYAGKDYTLSFFHPLFRVRPHKLNPKLFPDHLPSILLGPLVDAGSLWPGIATTTRARGGAAIAHGFSCSSSIHLVGVGTG